MNTRRTILTGAGIVAVGGLGWLAVDRLGLLEKKPAATGQAPAAPAAAPAPASPPPAAVPAAAVDGAFVLGSPDAKVTVIEYASMTCPHCAHFATTTFAEVKKQFIDTGKIRFVYRDFPLDGVALRASMLAQCAGAERVEPLIELLFRSQATWARAADPIAALKQTVKLAGVGDGQADACLADEALKNKVAQSRFNAERDFKIESTPSFVIGTKVASGALTIEEFTKFLKDNGLPD
ncbi:DsbA family protein [Oleomonas cavernae]|uniref:DsbA family protein n=1 Tax=Oleomonas cavernae TaxID=2320859 RepID=A0A418WD31_9PROT|nr:DsbA family protein [Oleomonas cavernae]RJF87858.1 DsbA family protein [Oleomonas cavernae]